MLELALKNIFHYKSRTLTTFFLVFFTTALFIIFVSFLDGSHNNILKSTVGVYTGPIQIMNKNYKINHEYDYLIKQTENIKNKLKAMPGIRAYSERLESIGLLATDENSYASIVTGINPETERYISRLEIAKTSGRFLIMDDKDSIYLGDELARKLEIRVGDRVSLIGSAIDESFMADTFLVVGTFKTGLHSFDSIASFVNKKYFDTLMESKGESSYIVVWPRKISETDDLISKIDLSENQDIKAYSWKELMEGMVQAMEVDSVFAYIQISILLVINFFVIMVFSFLNITSRTKDLGILRAIGMGKGDISRLLIIEGLLIAVFSIVPGAVLGSVVSYYFELNPIVIDGMAEMFKDYGIISDIVPAELNFFTVSWNMSLIFLINMVAVIYPIKYINKLTPLGAMHHV